MFDFAEVDDVEVSRNNEEVDYYKCYQNDDDDDDGDCSGWYQHHDEAGDYNGWYQYHDEVGDYNRWYQYYEEDYEHNGLDQQYAPVQNLYLVADNHDHALNLTFNEALSLNLTRTSPRKLLILRTFLLQITMILYRTFLLQIAIIIIMHVFVHFLVFLF